MPAFCGNCGAPVTGGFCAACGARVGQQTAPPPQSAYVAPVAPVAAAAGGSGLKIVLVIVGVLFVFGALGVAGIYLTGRSLLHKAQVAGLDTDAIAERASARSSGSGGMFGSLRDTVAGKRDGCALLPPDEVASILGVEVGKADGQSTAEEKQEHCDYFLKPGTSDAYAQKLKDSLNAAQSKAGPETKSENYQQFNEQTRKSGVESAIKNILRASQAVANDGSQPFFSFVVERQDGKHTFGVLQRANSAGKVLMNGNEVIEKLAGVGDGAFLGPMDSTLIVLKGDTCVTFNLTQVPDGKEKGTELAKRVISRL